MGKRGQAGPVNLCYWLALPGQEPHTPALGWSKCQTNARSLNSPNTEGQVLPEGLQESLQRKAALHVEI